MMRRSLLLAAALTAACAHAQALKLPSSFEKIAAKASNRVEISLDGPLLRVAGALLDDKDAEEAAAKKIASKLRGIYVHVYEFDDDESYADADLAALRSQLQAPQWSRIVSTREKDGHESVDVFMKKDGDAISGMVVIAAEPQQLTLVDIDGPISPEDLRSLNGKFGIPSVDAVRHQVHGKRAEREDDDHDEDDDP